VVLRADSAAAASDEVAARHEIDAPEEASALRSDGGCEEEVLRGVVEVLVRALVCRGDLQVARACDRDELLQVDPHTQKIVDVQDPSGDVHGLCEGYVVIAAQGGSHQDRALGVVNASARRVEVEVGEIRAYDRDEVVCRLCYC